MFVLRQRRWLAAGVALLAALAMADAARFGWGAATIEGDRVKWGLRSMGRSPLQPVIVVRDFCWWEDGARGLCSLVPGSDWAASVFRGAERAAWGAAAGFLVAAVLLARRARAALPMLVTTGVWTLGLGLLAVLAAHRIAIYQSHGLDPGWSGSLTWRAALVFSVVATTLARRESRAAAGPPTRAEMPAAR